MLKEKYTWEDKKGNKYVLILILMEHAQRALVH